MEAAAETLGLSPRRVRALIAAHRLQATRIGRRTWGLAPADVADFAATARPNGRPRGSRPPNHQAIRKHGGRR